MIPYMDGVHPSDLGLPDRFTEFRQAQIDMINRTLNSTKRFVAHAAPTGIGKSVALAAIAKYMGVRSVVCTSTKGLQEQYLSDFGSCGMVNVKGRSNFPCTSHPSETCEEGAHRKCRCASGPQGPDSTCPYKAQWASACISPLVCTNYSYWSTVQRFGQGIGEFGLLMLDEGHDAPDEISNQMTTSFSERELDMLDASWPTIPISLPQWKEWAIENAPRASTRYERLYQLSGMNVDTRTVKEIKAWSSLTAKLSTLSAMKGAWAVEQRLVRGQVDGYKLQPIWPYTYAEEVLFRGVGKVVIVSATLSRKTLQLLGIQNQDVDFYEYPSEFPADRCPVYSLPTVAMNHKSTSDDFQVLVDRVDEIIEGRLDRKGMIHGVSYIRARDIAATSRFGKYMITHQSGETQDAVKVFMESPAPAILVSPSITTGYDFAGELSEYQIICKAPYPDLRGAVQNARKTQDWLYPAYEMVMALVQASGRQMRSKWDQSETFLIDDTITKCFDKHTQLWPKWFRPLVKKVTEVPDPPPSLAEQEANMIGVED